MATGKKQDNLPKPSTIQARLRTTTGCRTPGIDGRPRLSQEFRPGARHALMRVFCSLSPRPLWPPTRRQPASPASPASSAQVFWRRTLPPRDGNRWGLAAPRLRPAAAHHDQRRRVVAPAQPPSPWRPRAPQDSFPNATTTQTKRSAPGHRHNTRLIACSCSHRRLSQLPLRAARAFDLHHIY